jgi:hypothetical protein
MPDDLMNDNFNDFTDVLTGVDNTPVPSGEKNDIPKGIGWEDEDDTKQATANTDDESSNSNEDSSDADSGKQTDDNAQNEDQDFYNPEVHFPGENAGPTKYKDRVSAYQGLAHKFTYLQKLGQDLEALGSGFGAIDMPEIIDDNLSAIDEYKDVMKISELDDEATRKAIMQADKTIKLAKQKLDRIESQNNLSQEIQQVDKQYSKAFDDAKKAVTVLDVDPDGKTDDDFMNEIEQRIQEFMDNVDEYVEEHGGKAYNQKLAELERAKSSIHTFMEAHSRKLQVESKVKNNQVVRATPEQIRDWYDEFKQDQSHLSIFNAPTEAPEVAFLEYVKKHGSDKLQGPQSFLKFYKQYQEALEQIRSKTKGNDVRKVAEDLKKDLDSTRSNNTYVPPSDRSSSSRKPLDAQLDDEIDNLLKSAVR